MPYQHHQIFVLHKIWVITNSKRAANIIWWVYRVINNCLLLSTFVLFKTPLTLLTYSALEGGQDKQLIVVAGTGVDMVCTSWLSLVLVGYGQFWLVLFGLGWLWLVLHGCGWYNNIDSYGWYQMVVVGSWVLSKGDRLAVLLMASNLLLLPNPHCHNVESQLESWKKAKLFFVNIETTTIIQK